MGVFVLTETSAGYALFKAKDKSIIKGGNVEDVVGALKLKQFLVWRHHISQSLELTVPRNSTMPSLRSTKLLRFPSPRSPASSASF